MSPSAGELEGVDPGAETVEGEGAEEAFFGGGAVGYDPTAFKALFNFRPEVDEGGCSGEVFGADAVDFLRGPGDGSVAGEVGREEVLGDDREGVHAGDADLDGDVSGATLRAGALEVDRGEAEL